jgi:hypothetical protein
MPWTQTLSTTRSALGAGHVRPGTDEHATVRMTGARDTWPRSWSFLSRRSRNDAMALMTVTDKPDSPERGLGDLLGPKVAIGVVLGLNEVSSHRLAGGVTVAYGDRDQDLGVPLDGVLSNLGDR